MSLLRQTGAVIQLLLAHERGNFQFQLFNAFVYPATIAYMGWMIVGDDEALLRTWMAGAICMGLGMGGFAQVGFGVITDRFRGRMDLLRCQPISKGAYLAGQIAVVMVISLALVGFAVGLFTLLGLARASGPTFAAAVAGGATAGASIGALGALLAFRARDFDSGNTTIAMAALGFALVSPVFYEVSALPALLQPVAWLSPFTGVAEILRTALAAGAFPLAALVWTLACAVLWGALSYRLIEWPS